MPSRLLPPATALLWVGLVWLGITASHFLLARQVELAGQVSEIQSQSDRHGRFWTVTVQGSGWSNTTRYYWPTNSEKVVLSAGDKVHLNASQGWLWLDVHNLSSTCLVGQSATMLLNAGQALSRTFRRGRSYGDYQFSLDAYAFPSEGQLIRAWFRLLSFIS